MKTQFNDRTGSACNDMSQWWRSTKRPYLSVLVYGQDGWTKGAMRYAIVDDFGTLVPVEV